MTNEPFDALIVGGGPAGLAAALALGRARRRVLLADAGPRRNAAATHVHNFLTRDGTPPEELRRIGREQLATYPSVELRDEVVYAIESDLRSFRVELGSGPVRARRILLCTGMIDESLPIEGFDERWGHAVYQCPYCHGWEVRDRPWGYLVTAVSAEHYLPFALQARQWTDTLTVFTNGAVAPSDDERALMDARGIRLVSSPVRRLLGEGQALASVEVAGGTTVPCEVLYAHPPQRHVPVVASLALDLDEGGYIRVDETSLATSQPGILAAGDLTTPMQGAILAAAAGTRAGAMINLGLAMEPD